MALVVGSRPRRNLLDTSQSRDSNALRASVLEAAIELGIGQSRPLADLIFNTVDEEDEPEILTTPALTSASATTSDESSPSVPPWNAAHPLFVPPSVKPAFVAPPLTFDTQSTRAPSEESHPPPSLRPNQPRKLRKARKDDGYDSEGGYLSDSSKKKKKNKDRKNTVPSSHEADFLSGGYLTDATKKTSDKKKKEGKGDKVTDGYVTDSSTKAQQKAAKKSRSHLDDADLPEGGYLSEVSIKKKKTFFRRLGAHSPSTSRKGGSSIDSLPPPVPALPPQPLPIADHYARSPIPSEQPDGGSVTPSIRTAYSPVPPSVDESLTPLTSAFIGRAWSPAPSDSGRTANRPPSADLSLENLSSSSTSHETGQFSPVMQSWEAVPYAHSRARSREAEGRTLSPGSSHEHLSAASRPHGVRFTPSTRFSPSESTFPSPPSPPEVPEVPVAPDNRQMRPKISLPITSTVNSNSTSASPSPSHLHSILRNSPSMSSPSDSRPFLSPAPRPRTAPSPKPPFLRGASPSLSDLSIISSSEFIVPSPRPRFYDELPPPSPPPTGPLPDVPSSSGGLYSQPIPSIKRGREAPFPARGVLPAEEASRLIESTLRSRREALLARLAHSEAAEAGHSGIGHGDHEFVSVDDNNIVPDLPWLAAETAPMPAPPSSPPAEQQHEDEQDWPDDESVRPDIAQFYLYEPSGNRVSDGVGDVVTRRRRSPDAPHDERSTYTYSYTSSTAGGGDARGDIESYYFGGPETASDGEGAEDNSTEPQSRASFVDDERSHNMRARLISRVDALYGAEKVPPVPKLRPF